MAKRKPITAKKSSAKTETPTTVSRPARRNPKATSPKKTRTIKVKKNKAVIFSSQTLQKRVLEAGKKLLQTVSVQTKILKTRLAESISQQRQKVKKNVESISSSLRSIRFPTFSLPVATKKKTSKKKKSKVRVIFQKKRKKTRSRFQKRLDKLARKILRFPRVAITAILSFIYTEILSPFIYIFRYHFVVTFLCLLVSAGILVGAYEVYDIAFRDLPSVTELTTRKPHLTTKIVDRNGKVLYSIYKDENRTLVPLAQLPQDLIHATIAIEDRNFYSHRGISIRGILRAFLSNTQSDRLQGGSTITQQLVKNTLLSPERTFKRKIREIVLAFIMEGTYSKDEILEMYFNEVGYGGSTYGVEEAAQRYFGKSARELDLAESAMLAGLPQSPSTYSPFGSTPEYAVVRQREVLQSMVSERYITPAQARAAENEKLNFRNNSVDIKAPHFVMYVKSLLEKQYGADVVDQGGLEVRTTLDLDTQNSSQDIVTNEVNQLKGYHITNGAALVTNPSTGEILAMIGSRDYFDFSHDGQVNVTTSPRQPGSSIKPLTYSLALEQGKTPSSQIHDEPVAFSMPGSPPYVPKNYDGKFHGVVTLRTALASSLNIPAVRTLAEVGINTMIDKGQEMGITTWQDRRRYGLALTLGSGEVLMVDMAQLYSTFANYGETVSLNPLLEVKNYKGEVLYHNSCALEKVDCPKVRTLDARVAYEIDDILSDNNARSLAFGTHSVLYIPNQQVPVKTGTTNNRKDNWTIGFTRDRLVAVWVGNNDGSPMSYVASGITGASPIWNKIIRTQLNDTHPSVFPPPDGFVKVKICANTNTLPCQGCPNVVEELFVPGSQPTQFCNPAQFRPRPQPNPSPDPNRDKILQGITTGH
jgi:1A family penicillin-binding protein